MFASELDHAAVYATLETIHGPHRVRVSEHMLFRSAGDLHEELHDLWRDARGLRTGEARPVSYPGYTVYGRAVKFLSVRSSSDPGWPADRPVLPLVNTL